MSMKIDVCFLFMYLCFKSAGHPMLCADTFLHLTSHERLGLYGIAIGQRRGLYLHSHLFILKSAGGSEMEVGDRSALV